jgi:OPA family glycerol-3-phosphate transporter-like MFS transporter
MERAVINSKYYKVMTEQKLVITKQSSTIKSQQWKMLLLTMFCYLFFYTGRHNFGWAAKPLAQALNISYEKIGWVSFAMLIGYALGQLINGNLADRVSPKHMIATGGLLSVLANVAISFCTSFTPILILWTLNGYFQSMAWASGSRIISNWWHDKNKGLAFGMYTLAAGCSSILTYLFSIMLVHQGWQNLFRIPVLFLGVAVVLFFIFVKNKPSDIGLPDAYTGHLQQPHWKEAYKVVLSNRRFLIVCLSLGFQSMARYGLIFWVPLYFMSKGGAGITSELWTSLLLPIGMATGALSFGFISDRLFKSDRIKSITLGMVLCCLVSLVIYFFNITGSITIGVLIFCAGFFSYGPQANFWPLSPELLGHRYVGTGIGIMNMCAYLFAAIGEPLMGKLIDMTGTKTVIFITVSIIALLSAGSIQLTRLLGKKKQYQNNNLGNLTTSIV